MGKQPPKFIEEIRQILSDNRFRRRFEYETEYPISVYKTDSELAMAFILYMAKLKFMYGVMYPKYGFPHCEVDFCLFTARLVRPLPDYANVVHWPSNRPVKWIEIKRNVHGKYEPRSKEAIAQMLKSKKKVGSKRAFLQREFLKTQGIETLPLGEDGLEYFYYHGFLAD